MKKIVSGIAIILFMLAVGCGETSSPSSLSGHYDRYSYSLFWRGSRENPDNIQLLVVNDFENAENAVQDRIVFGSNLDPIAGYQNRNGEIVTFSIIGKDKLLILDQTLRLRDFPVVFVTRNEEGQLNAIRLEPNSEIFEKVFGAITLVGNRNAGKFGWLTGWIMRNLFD